MDNARQPRQWWVAAKQDSVPRTRRAITDTVREWRIGADEESLYGIAVCASELLTNGVEHAWTAMLGVTVSWTGSAVRIEVIDDDPLVPAPGATDLHAVDGRGLAILDALGNWGAERRPYGKVVWAEIPIPLGSTWSDA